MLFLYVWFHWRETLGKSGEWHPAQLSWEANTKCTHAHTHTHMPQTSAVYLSSPGVL